MFVTINKYVFNSLLEFPNLNFNLICTTEFLTLRKVLYYHAFMYVNIKHVLSISDLLNFRAYSACYLRVSKNLNNSCKANRLPPVP